MTFRRPTYHQEIGTIGTYYFSDDIKGNIVSHIPLMKSLAKEFINHPIDSPTLVNYWTQILLLSFFRPSDQRYLCKLHLDPEHEDFLNVLAKFHIHYSQQRHGKLWMGGLSTSPKTLSDELSRQNIPRASKGLKEFYDHYNRMLDRKRFLLLGGSSGTKT